MFTAAEAERFVACIENQEHLRAELARNGWLAFVGDEQVARAIPSHALVIFVLLGAGCCLPR